MPGDHWARHFFDDLYLVAEGLELTDAVTAAECNVAIKLTQVAKGQHVLDLGCGHGRHAIELGHRGYGPVVGIDISEQAIEYARGDAALHKVAVEFLTGDMHALEFDSCFDVVLSFYSSMFYWDDAVNLSILRGVHRALKPQGLFAVDFYNRDSKTAELAFERSKPIGWLLQQKGMLGWWKRRLIRGLRPGSAQGVRRTKERTFDVETGILNVDKHYYVGGGSRITKTISVRLYTVAELKALMLAAGFEIMQVADSSDGGVARLSSARLTMIARRCG